MAMNDRKTGPRRVTRRDLLKRGGAIAAGLAVAGAAAGSEAAPSLPALAPRGARPVRQGTGRVVVAQGVDPTVLDPDMHRETPSSNVIRHIYDALVDRDADGRLTPVLAQTWEWRDDTTLELKLRSGVAFSTGEPFNAEVAKYNLDRVADKLGARRTLNAANYASIDEVTAVDDTTLRIKLKRPNPVFIRYLRDKYMVPMKHTRDNGFDALAEKPIGTGWYTLKEWIKSDRLVLTANGGSWRGQAPIGEVVFRPIPENATRVAELKTGNVDVIVNVPPDQVEILKLDDKIDVRSVPSARIAGVFLNTLDFEPLKDRRVRLALNHAVDVDSIAKNVMNGFARPVSTWSASFFVGHDPNAQPLGYDPEKAKALLAEAGYANGFECELLTPRGRYLNDVQVVQALAAMLDRVGVKVRINAVEFGVFAKLTQERTIPPMFFAAWGNSPWNVYDTLTALVKTGGAFSWYSNPQVDELVDKAGSTADEALHADYLKQALAIIRDDASHIFLYQQEDIYAVSKRLKWQPRSDETLDMFAASL